MALTYKVRQFNTDIGSILVSVHDNSNAEVGRIVVDVPIDENNQYIVGDDLAAHIQTYIPEEHYTRIATTKAGISNASAITALIEADVVVEADAKDTAAVEAIEAAILKTAVDKILTAHELI